MRRALAAGALTALIVTGTAGTASARPPKACTRALDAADALILEAGAAITTMAEGFGQAARFDVAGLNATTDRIDAHTATIKRLRLAYDVQAIKCRAVR